MRPVLEGNVMEGSVIEGDLFELSETPLDTAELSSRLASSHAGAFVSFEGRVRDSDGDRAVSGLDYDAYPRMCLKVGEAIVREVLPDVIAAKCVHRVGSLRVGEVSVWVGVIAGHRDEAFRGCRHIIDEVKRRVPIWKKERYADGQSRWVGLHVAGPKDQPVRRDA
jgi:molybdopterin synthase catalytic subunit